MKRLDFHQRTRGARRVVVVDLGFLGDAVHTIPACWELRRAYPGAELHTVFAPVGAEVMALAPCVHRSWAWPRVRGPGAWRADLRRLRELRRQRFDVAINFSGADRPVILAGLLGARWRLGHPGDRRHFWSRWLIPWWTERQRRDQPMAESRRRALESAGFALGECTYGLAVPPGARAAAAEAVPAGAVHLSINASGPLKEWPLPHWVAFVRLLRRRFPDLPVIATGSAKERERLRLRSLAEAVDDPRLLVVHPDSVALLAAILLRCRAHVGADSGALQLAAALGVPCLGLFRDYEGLAEWAPAGPQHRLLTRRCPCDIHRRETPVPPCGFDGPARCLDGIPPEEALAALAEMLRPESALPA